jgi:hypothetical protein
MKVKTNIRAGQKSGTTVSVDSTSATTTSSSTTSSGQNGLAQKIADQAALYASRCVGI